MLQPLLRTSRAPRLWFMHDRSLMRTYSLLVSLCTLLRIKCRQHLKGMSFDLVCVQYDAPQDPSFFIHRVLRPLQRADPLSSNQSS